MNYNAIEFVRTLNSIPVVERKCPAVKMSQHFRSFQKLLMTLGTISSMVLSLVTLGYLFNSCLIPWYGAILFLDQDGVCHLQNLWVTCVLMVVEFYWLVNAVFMAVFAVTHVFGLGVNFIIHSLSVLKR